MKVDTHAMPGYRGNTRAEGVRLGRFILRTLGLMTPPAEFLPIFEHCTILKAEFSYSEGGIEYLALSPKFDPVDTKQGDFISDRTAPRYEWEVDTDPDTGRVYAARPVRVS